MMLTVRMWRRRNATERGRPAEAEGDEDERDAEAERVREARAARRARPSRRSSHDMARIAASVGPMHGVQPMPSAMPEQRRADEAEVAAHLRLERALREPEQRR